MPKKKRPSKLKRNTVNPRHNKYEVGDWLESAGFDYFPTKRSELEWIWTRAIPQANERLRNLERFQRSEKLSKPTFAYSEAQTSIKLLRGSERYRRFDEKEIPEDYNRLEREVKMALKFLNSQTSTKEGYLAWRENIRESLTRSFNVQDFTGNDLDNLGRILSSDKYSKMLAYLPSDQIVDLLIQYKDVSTKKVDEIFHKALKSNKDVDYSYLEKKLNQARKSKTNLR